VIPTIITQVVAGNRRIELGAIHPTRDFNYVQDTARGMLAVLRSDAAIGEVINIGSAFEISVGDTAALIAEILGVEVEIEQKEQRKRPELSEVERLFAANEKARRVLGWSPQYGGREGFRRGLTETITWFRNPENLARYRVGGYTL
jgi:dTDP-glucose 4,6-dehydratase